MDSKSNKDLRFDLPFGLMFVRFEPGWGIGPKVGNEFSGVGISLELYSDKKDTFHGDVDRGIIDCGVMSRTDVQKLHQMLGEFLDEYPPLPRV